MPNGFKDADLSHTHIGSVSTRRE